MSFLRFDEAGTSESGKTKMWLVFNAKNQQPLGDVLWYGPWRRYCFHTTPIPCVFDVDCLKEITAFLTARTEEHKARSKEGAAP